MTISLDRPATQLPGAGNPQRPAETRAKLAPVPEGDAHLAACALHLLLAQHPDLVDLPIRWEIEGGTVIPRLPHRDTRTLAMAQLVADALELELHSHAFTATDGVRMHSIWLEGRWGGAAWTINAYGLAEGGDRDE
jgi:hypothetical protein